MLHLFALCSINDEASTIRDLDDYNALANIKNIHMKRMREEPDGKIGEARLNQF
ncbi:hypothetical protein [Bacillus sp. 1P06AnD]|uniref:hypothetical protein n=1 Tax=Bacillus sp. 1P06AnD TaxID=3132208 RepID=UPI00399F01D9